MTILHRKILIIAFTLLFTVLSGAFSVNAQDGSTVTDDGGSTVTDSGGSTVTGNTTPGPTSIDLQIPNPLAGTVDTVPQFFQKVVDIVIKIGVPIVAIAILYSGFLFVWARGRPTEIGKAKEALLFAVIGGLVLLASCLVAEAIKDALTTINA